MFRRNWNHNFAQVAPEMLAEQHFNIRFIIDYKDKKVHCVPIRSKTLRTRCDVGHKAIFNIQSHSQGGLPGESNLSFSEDVPASTASNPNGWTDQS